jgi:hypothetical protein
MAGTRAHTRLFPLLVLHPPTINLFIAEWNTEWPADNCYSRKMLSATLKNESRDGRESIRQTSLVSRRSSPSKILRASHVARVRHSEFLFIRVAVLPLPSNPLRPHRHGTPTNGSQHTFLSRSLPLFAREIAVKAGRRPWRSSLTFRVFSFLGPVPRRPFAHCWGIAVSNFSNLLPVSRLTNTH